MFKAALSEANRNLTRYNNLSEKQSMWSFLHRWNYDHNLIKNMLKITNKIVRGLNRYHIFRWDWMVGIFGVGVGLVVTWLEEAYYQTRVGFKPMVRQGVILGVLRNEGVQGKLKSVLDNNVFANSDIQFYVHQALLNQVLQPQKEAIKLLIQTALDSLSQPSSCQSLAETIAPYISKLKEPIGSAALSFLNSPKMDEIAARGIVSVLQSLYIKSIMGDQSRYYLNCYLQEKSNVDFLYSGLRESFIF